MRRSVVAAAAVLAVVAGAARAGAGPVKHWGPFPGREVRALAMRGDRFGGETRYDAVQGRDGYVYVRGRLGLYRVLDDGGRIEDVADTAQCSGWTESHGVDDRTRVPRAICTRAAQIIVASATRHRHVRVGTPGWPGAFRYVGRDRLDDRYLTTVVPANGGGYWYGFAVPGAVGRVAPSGRAELHRIPGLGPVTSMVAAGDDVYVTDGCRVVHLRGFAVIDQRDYDCLPSWNHATLTQTSDGAVWVCNPGDGVVERRGRGGARSEWKLRMSPASVAVTRDGTAYVLGLTGGGDQRAHPTIAVIAPGSAPQIRVLPMLGAETIAVDGRDRIWISDPLDHAFAVIAPNARR